MADGYVFFFGPEDFCSNFYSCKFREPETGFEYFCSEQCFMMRKAAFFHDEEIIERMKVANTAKKVKALGRKVKDFDEEAFSAVRAQLMREAVLLKFGQNPELKQMLLDTGDKTLVEASPYDQLWGAGWDKEQCAAQPGAWPGRNLLGEVLMGVRETLRTQLE